jgi:hypothetical protein
MRKTTPINSTPNRLPVNPEKLNRHYRDLRRLNNIKSHPTVTKPSKQARKSGIRDCSGEQCIYTQLAERQNACVRDCQGKRSIQALKQGQAREKRLKTQTQSEQNLSSSDTTRNTKEKEQCKKKKYFNP